MIASVLLLAGGCRSSQSLLTVVNESVEGNTELTYANEVKPEKLVQEVRLNAGGDTLSITSLKAGVLHGELVMFHPNGNRKEDVTYKDGKQDGPYHAYDTEGFVIFEGLLKEGLKQGVWTSWYDHTQMRQQCHYENDILAGKCTYWFIDGNIQREETYSDGKLIASEDH